MNTLCCIAPVSLDPGPNQPGPTLFPGGPDLEVGEDEEGGGGGSDGIRRAVEGLVYKWVNYGKGWRDRWMVLRDGVLSYYKLRGPAKVVVGGSGDGDGFVGRVVIGEESKKYLRKRGFGSGRNFGQSKPFGEVHLKVGLIWENGDGVSEVVVSSFRSCLSSCRRILCFLSCFRVDLGSVEQCRGRC